MIQPGQGRVMGLVLFLAHFIFLYKIRKRGYKEDDIIVYIVYIGSIVLIYTLIIDVWNSIIGLV